MRYRRGLIVVVIACWGVASFVGCASDLYVVNDTGKREGLFMRVVELPRGGATAEPDQKRWKVAVEPFLDKRTEKSRVGTHHSRLGSTTPVYAVDADVSRMMTLLVIDALKRQKGWDVWLDRPGVALPEGGPNVRITGEILECEVNAEPSFFTTTITADVKMVVHAWNSADGSTAEILIKQDGRDRQVWFEPEDAEAQFNATLHASLMQLVTRAEIHDRLFGFSSDQHGDHRTVRVPNTDPSSTFNNKKGNP